MVDTTNHWTNWTAVVALPKGTNVFRAFASDFAANNSPTNTVTFVASNAFTMILSFGPAQPSPTSGLNLDLDVSLWVTGRIQVSTDLVHWITLTNFVSTHLPLLESWLGSGQQRMVTLYGIAGKSYEVRHAPTVNTPAPWPPRAGRTPFRPACYQLPADRPRGGCSDPVLARQ